MSNYSVSRKFTALLPLALLMSARCNGQISVKTVSLRELKAVTGLELSQAVAARETYKKPLRAALARQTGRADTACDATSGQQSYNICMGKADEAADNDFAIFYNNLQMLCHDDDQLLTLQQFEKQWKDYSVIAMKAARVQWRDGTGASGFASQIHLSLVRDYIRELSEIYGLDISQ